jgi:hypothetical protein
VQRCGANTCKEDGLLTNWYPRGTHLCMDSFLRLKQGQYLAASFKNLTVCCERLRSCQLNPFIEELFYTA